MLSRNCIFLFRMLAILILLHKLHVLCKCENPHLNTRHYYDLRHVSVSMNKCIVNGVSG